MKEKEEERGRGQRCLSADKSLQAKTATCRWWLSGKEVDGPSGASSRTCDRGSTIHDSRRQDGNLRFRHGAPRPRSLGTAGKRVLAIKPLTMRECLGRSLTVWVAHSLQGEGA